MASRLKLPQDLETSLRVEHSGAFIWRYAYARSLEARKYNDSGQDYLVFDQSPDRFLFALCDGVSQSFFGNLAARFLGDRLVEWLDFAPAVLKEDVLTASLRNCLNELALKTNPEIVAYPLPESVPALLRQVLEQKRFMGSESTFACGRVDLPGSRFPFGRLLLAWMGDSRLRFWGPTGERSAELGPRFETAQRWSSRQAAVGGDPNVFACTLQDNQGSPLVVRCLAYSDGLAVLDSLPGSISNQDLQQRIDAMDNAPTNDDISVLELVFDLAADRNSPAEVLKETRNSPQNEIIESESSSAPEPQKEEKTGPLDRKIQVMVQPLRHDADGGEDEDYPEDAQNSTGFIEPPTQPLKNKKFWRFWSKDDAL
jgi:hypothetical protein